MSITPLWPDSAWRGAVFAIGFLVFTLMLKVAVPISLGAFMGEPKRETAVARA
jgi:hypothetical protein